MMNAIEKFNINVTEVSEDGREATFVVDPLVREHKKLKQEVNPK